jgi:hypothetical protein
MKTSPCKGCGKPIVWGETVEGKKIPLDPKPPCYAVSVNVPNGRVWARREEEVMVSHFATCPKANDFSGSRKKES